MNVRANSNLIVERPTFVTHLECSWTGETYEADKPHNLSRAGKPLLGPLRPARLRPALTKEALARTPARSMALARVAAGTPRRATSSASARRRRR